MIGWLLGGPHVARTSTSTSLQAARLSGYDLISSHLYVTTYKILFKLRQHILEVSRLRS